MKCLLKSSNFALIVELVVQRTLDALLHGENQLDVGDMLCAKASHEGEREEEGGGGGEEEEGEGEGEEEVDGR